MQTHGGRGDEAEGQKVNGSGIGTEHYVRDKQETEKREKTGAKDLTLPAQAWSACPDASLSPRPFGKYWPQSV